MQKKQFELWLCKRCKRRLPVAMFSQWLKDKKDKRYHHGKAWCNDCKDLANQEEERIAENNYECTQHPKKT